MNQLVESVCDFHQKIFLNLFHKKLGDSKSERIFAPLSKEGKTRRKFERIWLLIESDRWKENSNEC